MSERKIELILEWIERNPAKFKAVRDKVDDLGTATKAAYRTVASGLKTEDQVQAAQAATADSYTNALDAVLSTVPSYKMAKDIQQRMARQAMATQVQIFKLGERIRKAGRQIGFFGWIISYAARSMVRQLTQVLNWFIKLIKVTADWPESLEKVAVAMGLLQSQGLLSADMADLLSQTMQRLIKDGPKFQALWAGFEALFIAFASILTSNVLPSLTELLNTLAEFLTRKDVQDLIARIGEQMVKLAESIIPALPNLMQVVSILLDVANALSPLMPLILPLIPIIMVLPLH